MVPDSARTYKSNKRYKGTVNAIILTLEKSYKHIKKQEIDKTIKIPQ